MKKILIPLFAALAISSTSVFAEDGSQTVTTTTSTSSKVGNWFDNITGKYYQDLDLTTAQKTQLRDIHQKYRLEEEKEVKAVLTPTQQDKWEELKKSRKDAYLNDNEENLKK